MKSKILEGIYAITPDDLKEEVLLEKIRGVLEIGIKLIQFREKNRAYSEKLILGKKIRKICNDFHSTLIINDDPLLARNVKADGVHLGQDDLSYKKSRDILGPTSIIGISCQNDLNLALKAQSEGADYVSFGSVFQTKTKEVTVNCSLNELKFLANKINLPTVAIGGINKNNINKLKSIGVDMFGVSSGLFEESPREIVNQFIKEI